MQVLIPRSHEVGKIQQERLHHQVVQNQLAGEEMRIKSIRQQQSANKLDNIVNDNIRDNQKRNKGDHSDKEKVSKDKKETAQDDNVSSHLGKILDIQI